MNLKAPDFEKLQFNVYDTEEGIDLLLKFPELTKYPEFLVPLQDINKSKLIKYIVYCYDKRSPFVTIEKNLLRRKVMCAKESGWSPDAKGKFDAHVEAIIKGEDAKANRMVIRYVRMHRDSKYSLLVAAMEMYYENIYQITNSDKGDDARDATEKANLFAKTKILLDDIDSLADEVFNQDLDMKHIADEVTQEEAGYIKSFPEHIAKKNLVDEL
jgi:hypothetical protein